MKKLVEESSRMSELAEHERNARKEGLNVIQAEVYELERRRNVNDERFRMKILEDIEQLRKALRNEAEARQSAEDTLIYTMDHIVQQVKESLRVVV